MTQWLLPTLAVVLLGGCAQFNVAMDNKGEAAISAIVPTLFNRGEDFVNRVSEAAGKTCSIYRKAHGNSVWWQNCSSFSKRENFITKLEKLEKDTKRLCNVRDDDEIKKIRAAVYDYCSELTADEGQNLIEVVRKTCGVPVPGNSSFTSAEIRDAIATQAFSEQVPPDRLDNDEKQHIALERVERGIVMAKQLLGLADIIPKHSVEVKFRCEPVRSRLERKAGASP